MSYKNGTTETFIFYNLPVPFAGNLTVVGVGSHYTEGWINNKYTSLHTKQNGFQRPSTTKMIQ